MEEKRSVSMLEENRVFEPSDSVKMKAYIKNMEQYRELYQRSIDDPEGFWGEMAEQLDWYKKWDKVLEWDFNKPEIKWFVGGKLNASYNCLDRHLNHWRSNKVALIWQGEPLEENRIFTYQQFHYHVCKFANVLKKYGVKKGDRVSIYLPLIPELPMAMLACARIGAIHSVVFGGFSSEALHDRINDCGSKILITADGYYRNGRIVQNKVSANEALKDCPGVEKVIVVKRLGIYAFVTLKTGVKSSEEMRKELLAHVRKTIGPIATPDKLQFADALPKTRSGKIMRRILRKIAEGRIEELGDTSTLTDPGVVIQLAGERI